MVAAVSSIDFPLYQLPGARHPARKSKQYKPNDEYAPGTRTGIEPGPGDSAQGHGEHNDKTELPDENECGECTKSVLFTRRF